MFTNVTNFIRRRVDVGELTVIHFIKGLLNYRLIHTKYYNSISEQIPVVNAGY